MVGRTSSSTRVIRAWRYSSMVIWKASTVFRLTGTVFYCFLFFSKNHLVSYISNNSSIGKQGSLVIYVPSRISPTSSIVRSRPV